MPDLDALGRTLAPLPGDGPICGAILHMLREQQDRDGLPRYLEALDTSEHGSAIANKTGALDQVRNDVALIATKNGPVVIAGFTWDNADQRWTGDNEGAADAGQAGAGDRARAGRPLASMRENWISGRSLHPLGPTAIGGGNRAFGP